MGFIRTALAVARELGERYSRVPVVQNRDREWFELLQGLTKIPKQEFGRFDRFGIDNLGHFGAAGVFYDSPIGKGNIQLSKNITAKSKLEDFLHELTHAKQFNPDIDDLYTMQKMVVGSGERVPYESQPIEVHARRVAGLSSIKPDLLNKYFKETINTNLEGYITRGLRSASDRDIS